MKELTALTCIPFGSYRRTISPGAYVVKMGSREHEC